MKFVQHLQAQFANGQNISIELTETEVVLNKTLKIPFKEIADFTEVLKRFIPSKVPQPVVRSRNNPVVLGAALLEWVGKSDGYERYGPGTLIYGVAKSASVRAQSPIVRDVLQDQLAVELGVKRSRVVSSVSCLIHKEKQLKVVVQR
jgi:hypothetical protein